MPNKTRTPPGLANALASSIVGFGTGAIGYLYAPVSDTQAHDALEAAWETGTRYFDTAPLYGNGTAERRLGSFLAGRSRHEYALSTKVGRVVDEELELTSTPAHDYSRAAVRRSLEGSLQRLGVEHVDVALVHDPDDHWEQASREALPELLRMRDEGMIGAVGAGMNQAGMLHRFVVETDIDCVLVAGRYTLLDRSAEADLLPACLERDVFVIAGGVFNGGILANPSVNAHFDYRPAPSMLLERVRRLELICGRFDVPLGAAALRFPLTHPAIITALVGARSREEVLTDVELAKRDIPPELWESITNEEAADDRPVASTP